jgi:hypothetical protein
VKDLELNSQRPHMEDNEFTRRIRSLENKLDKAMIKYNESQSIRKTYESILYRLNEERVGFDNQLSAIEKTLQAKQRDYDELLLLSGKTYFSPLTFLFLIRILSVSVDFCFSYAFSSPFFLVAFVRFLSVLPVCR